MPRGPGAQQRRTPRHAIAPARPSRRAPPSTIAGLPIAALGRSGGTMPSPMLLALQAEYTAWADVLPDELRNTATAEALRAIVDLEAPSQPAWRST